MRILTNQAQGQKWFQDFTVEDRTDKVRQKVRGGWPLTLPLLPSPCVSPHNLGSIYWLKTTTSQSLQVSGMFQPLLFLRNCWLCSKGWLYGICMGSTQYHQNVFPRVDHMLQDIRDIQHIYPSIHSIPPPQPAYFINHMPINKSQGQCGNWPTKGWAMVTGSDRWQPVPGLIYCYVNPQVQMGNPFAWSDPLWVHDIIYVVLSHIYYFTLSTEAGVEKGSPPLLLIYSQL